MYVGRLYVDLDFKKILKNIDFLLLKNLWEIIKVFFFKKVNLEVLVIGLKVYLIK